MSKINKSDALDKLLGKILEARKNGEKPSSKVENRIVKLSEVSNKITILKDFYRKIEVYLSYGEEGVFPIGNYRDLLLDK